MAEAQGNLLLPVNTLLSVDLVLGGEEDEAWP